MMTRKLLIIILGASALCLGGCQDKAAKADAVAQGKPASAGFMIEEKAKTFSFSYTVPDDVAAFPGLAEEFRQDAEKQKAEFVESANETAKDRAEFGGPDMSNEFDASWKKGSTAGPLVSLEFSLYRFDGGAHPNTYMDSRLIDTGSGKSLSLQDLFQEPLAQTRLPDALCNAIKRVKVDVYGEPVTCSGDKATVKLDGPFLLMPSVDQNKAAGLQFLFPPYVLGPYVEGAHVIDVPAEGFMADLKTVYAPSFNGRAQK